MAKDHLDLLEEFHLYGYVTHDCPNCGCECDPTEVDNVKAFCSDCDDLVDVPAVI